MKTLLVEDDPTVRPLIEAVLQTRGHQVTAFADAETAWEAYRRDGFALILIDWHLPGMDSLELCRRIRAHPRGGRSEILVLTGSPEPRGPTMALDAGADD